MYLCGQAFFKTPHKTLKFQENSRKINFTVICRPKLKYTISIAFFLTDISKKSVEKEIVSFV